MTTIQAQVGVRDTVKVVAQLGLFHAYRTFHATLRRDPLMRLFSEAGRSNPYPLYEQLRAQGRLPRSTTGVHSTVDHRVADALLRSRDVSVSFQRANSTATVLDLSLLELDPPDHTRLRALVAPAFTPRRMREQAGPVGVAVERLADQLTSRLAQGPVDLMETFARPLPVVMISSLLGIPDADVPALQRYGDSIGGALDGVGSLRHHREILTARANLRAMFGRLAEERQRDPGEDAISRLVAAREDGRATQDELLSLASLLLVAGFETTINLLGNAVAALLDRPHLWQRLVDDPTLADSAIDETLRFDAPVQLTGRTTVREVDADGEVLPAGRDVVVLLGGANRDPAVFDRPGEFRLDRPNPRDHLGFSTGIHHCLGRPLAELEGRLALAALARRVPGLRRAGPETMGDGMVLHGRRTLPVRVG